MTTIQNDQKAGRAQPADGQLIQAHREASNMTAAKAGRLAGMSENQWRWLERGWRPKGEGHYVRTRMSTERLVAMARIVGLGAASLAMVRPDAAAELTRIEAADNPRVLAELLSTIRDVLGEDVFDVALTMMDDVPAVPEVFSFPSVAR